MSSELEKVTEDIDIAVDLLDLLKSRYFFLRAKYDIDLNSQSAYASKDIQSEYQYASNDLQSFIMLELNLLEYACTYGIYSMNMYATRLKTNLNYNDKDHYFLKLLKDHLRSLIETNKSIKNISVDPFTSFTSYINSFKIYANVLDSVDVSNITLLNETNINKRKNKLMKKISKINLMANIITLIVSDHITDYKTEDGRAALNICLKYRTTRSIEYYTKKCNSN
ncbi:hypothetical protein ACI65C_000050 [Semiaphis heraclei]